MADFTHAASNLDKLLGADDPAAVRKLERLVFDAFGGSTLSLPDAMVAGGDGNDTMDAGAGLGPMSRLAGDDMFVVQAAERSGAVVVSGGSGQTEVLAMDDAIGGNALRSLGAVRAAVGARRANGTAGVDKTILVIGGADEAQFGVCCFEDRDNNATIDVADLLTLLAIGQGDVPAFGSGRGFTLSALDIL